MRLVVFFFCLMSAIAAALPARAGMKVTTTTTTFPISGTSGAALLAMLDRKGPKHGHTTRAIAQTRYAMNPEFEFVHANGHCTVAKPSVRLDITYIYPELTGPVPGVVRLRWLKFMAGVTRHEQVHGRIAREMALAAEKTMKGLRVADSSGCAATKAQLRRSLMALVATHERRQRSFDAAEHKAGGNIDMLMRRLRAD